jgi:hypothetical protein
MTVTRPAQPAWQLSAPKIKRQTITLLLVPSSTTGSAQRGFCRTGSHPQHMGMCRCGPKRLFAAPAYRGNRPTSLRQPGVRVRCLARSLALRPDFAVGLPFRGSGGCRPRRKCSYTGDERRSVAGSPAIRYSRAESTRVPLRLDALASFLCKNRRSTTSVVKSAGQWKAAFLSNAFNSSPVVNSDRRLPPVRAG